MTTPTTDLQLSEIQTEFGGTNPISMSEYYRGGANVPSNQATSVTDGVAISTSGAIRFGMFRGVTKNARSSLNFTFASNSTNQTINVASASNQGGATFSGSYSAGTTDITITVNSGVYVYSTSTANAGLTLTGGSSGDTVTIVNNGFILGQGGRGGGNDGSNYQPAIAGGNAINLGGGSALTLSTFTITRNSGSYVAAGGGGGGCSATSSNTNLVGSGGGGAGGGLGGRNAGAGSASGGGPGSNGSNASTTGLGGGGGRVLPGTNTSATGGSAPGGSGGGSGGLFTSGPSVGQGGGGGGGYGASGGPGSNQSGRATAYVLGFGGGANNTGGQTVYTSATSTAAQPGAAGGIAVAKINTNVGTVNQAGAGTTYGVVQ